MRLYALKAQDPPDQGRTPDPPGDAGRSRAGLLPDLPDWIGAEVVVGLALAGLIAFAITGFLGWRLDPGPFSALPRAIRAVLFLKPTALFLFAFLLIVTLQTYIMRHPSPRQEMAGDPDRIMPQPDRLIAALVVTAAATGIVALTDLRPGWAHDFLQWLANLLGLGHQGQLIANLINLAFIGVFAADAGGRVLGRGRALAAAGRDRPLRERQLAALLTELADDLIAGALLLALLSVAFRPAVLDFFALVFLGEPREAAKLLSGAAQPSQPFSNCTVSIWRSTCRGAGQTISLVDWNAAQISFILGLVALGLYLLVRLISLRRPLAEVLADAVRDLRNINRLLSLVLEELIAPLRRALWPGLIVAGMFFVAIAAKFAQYYLWQLSLEHQPLWYDHADGPMGPFGASGAMPFDLAGQNYIYLGVALGMSALAALAIVGSAMIQLYDRDNPDRSERQVLGYWLPALARVAGLVVIPFGVLSLALCLFNYFVVAAWSSPHGTPLPMSYFPPGIVTYVAALVAAYVLIAPAVRRRRLAKR